MKSGRISILTLTVVLACACSDDANLGSDQGKDPVGSDTDASTSLPSESPTPDDESGATEDTATPTSDENSSDDATSGEDDDPTSSDPEPTTETSNPIPDPMSSDTPDPDPSTDSSDPPNMDPVPVVDAGADVEGPLEPDAATGNPDPTPNDCEQFQCFRAVECVETCGGPVLVASCCPCAEGTFDSIMCTVEPAPDAGSPESDAGASYTLSDLHSACGDDGCPSGLTAMRYYGIAGPSGPEFCSCEIPCAEDPGVCPKGTSCGTISDGPGTVCIAQPGN